MIDREQFADILRDIADSYMDDPDQRQELVEAVLAELDELQR
jgi:hypothetical protein